MSIFIYKENIYHVAIAFSLFQKMLKMLVVVFSFKPVLKIFLEKNVF